MKTMSGISGATAISGLCAVITLSVLLQGSCAQRFELVPEVPEVPDLEGRRPISCCPRGSIKCSRAASLGGDYCCSGRGAACADNGNCLVPGFYCNNRSDTTFSITVDNVLSELYLDGIQVPQSQLPHWNYWYTSDTVPLPGSVRVIALKATNAETNFWAGVLASDASGTILTNSNWKCIRTSSVLSSTWMQPSFSDAAWPVAVANGVNSVSGSPPWRYVPGINVNARWIWSTTGYTTEQTIYCRLTLY